MISTGFTTTKHTTNKLKFSLFDLLSSVVVLYIRVT